MHYIWNSVHTATVCCNAVYMYNWIIYFCMRSWLKPRNFTINHSGLETSINQHKRCASYPWPQYICVFTCVLIGKRNMDEFRRSLWNCITFLNTFLEMFCFVTLTTFLEASMDRPCTVHIFEIALLFLIGLLTASQFHIEMPILKLNDKPLSMNFG